MAMDRIREGMRLMDEGVDRITVAQKEDKKQLLGETLIDSNKWVSQRAGEDNRQYDRFEVDEIVRDSEGLEHKVIHIKVVDGERLYALQLMTCKDTAIYKVFTGASIHSSASFQVGHTLVLRLSPQVHAIRAEVMWRVQGNHTGSQEWK